MQQRLTQNNLAQRLAEFGVADSYAQLGSFAAGRTVRPTADGVDMLAQVHALLRELMLA